MMGVFTVQIFSLLVIVLRCIAALTEVGRFEQPVRLICMEDHNPAPVTDASWRKDGQLLQVVDAKVSNFSSPVSLENGQIVFPGADTVSSLRPGDEGIYSCASSTSSDFGNEYEFYVPPYVAERNPHLFHERGTLLTIPCGVTIGKVSYTRKVKVEWIRTKDGKQFDSPIRTYDSTSNDTTVLVNGRYELDPTDFSLRVSNFTREDLVHQCTVTTQATPDDNVNSFSATAETSITILCNEPQIVRPLPVAMVIQPGKEVNLNFTFTSSPNAVVEWSVDGSVVTTTGTDNFTASIVFTPMEAEGGNVTATVMMCDNSTTTETNLVVVASVAELVASQEECGTPVLSFSLPKELPEANLNIELQIRFTEILGGQTGKTISKSYAAAEIAGKTNIENFELKHLPPDMKDFGQYQVQVMLVVNGTKSVDWSPTSHTLCSHRQVAVLELTVDFEDTCDTVEEVDIYNAIEASFGMQCQDCEEVEFKMDSVFVGCVGDELTFKVQIESFAAESLVQDYYQYLDKDEGGVEIEVKGQKANVQQCDSCEKEQGSSSKPEDEKDKYMFYGIIASMGGLAVILILLVVFVVVYRRRKKSTSQEYTPGGYTPSPPPERLQRPCPLPRPSPPPQWEPIPGQPSETAPPLHHVGSGSPMSPLPMNAAWDIAAPQLDNPREPSTYIYPGQSRGPTPPPYPPTTMLSPPSHTPSPSSTPVQVVYVCTPPPSPLLSHGHSPPPSIYSTPPPSPPPPQNFVGEGIGLTTTQHLAIDTRQQLHNPYYQCECCRYHHRSNPELQNRRVPSSLSQLHLEHLVRPAQRTPPQPTQNLWSQDCSYVSRYRPSSAYSDRGRQRHPSEAIEPRCCCLQCNERKGFTLNQQWVDPHLHPTPTPVPSAFHSVRRGYVPTHLASGSYSDRASSVPPQDTTERRVSESNYVMRPSVASCSSVASAPPLAGAQPPRPGYVAQDIANSAGFRPSPPSCLAPRPPFKRMRSQSCSDAESPVKWPCTVNSGCTRRLPEISPNSEQLLRTLNLEDGKDGEDGEGIRTGLWLMRMYSCNAGGSDQQSPCKSGEMEEDEERSTDERRDQF